MTTVGANNKLYDLEINDDSDIETIKVPENAVQIHVGFTDLNFHNIKSKKYKYSITSEDEITTEWNEINENTINIGRQGCGSSLYTTDSYTIHVWLCKHVHLFQLCISDVSFLVRRKS